MMSYPGIDHHLDVLIKPPAAPPRTSMFSLSSAHSPRTDGAIPPSELHSESQVQPTSSTSQHPSHDNIPVQWTFESNYGMFGKFSGTGTASPQGSRIGQRKDPHEGGALIGSWFGRKKDKDEFKPKLNSDSDREKSIDAPVQLPHPDSSISTIPGAIPFRRQKSDSLPPIPSQDQDSDSLPSMSTAPITAGQQAPPRPTRSPLRPPPTAKSDDTTDWFLGWLSTSTPPLNVVHVSGKGKQVSRSRSNLSTIAASNLPTPNESRAPSPISHTPPRPSPVHNTALRRQDTVPSSSRRGTPPLAVANTRFRRPATSSGVSTTRDREHLVFPGETHSTYGNLSTSMYPFSSLVGSTPTYPSASTVSSTHRTLRTETSKERLKNRMRNFRERGFKMKNGKRHHPQPKDEAPYPRDYERKTIDHDRWEHVFAVRLAKRSTFYSFSTPPKKVLDLGCGSGEWILECAREWKDTNFIGLDLVPLQPDLALLGQPDLVRRIKWVIGNFLHKLPFEDGEFDFVHVRRVARGVPEDQWDSLFEEITRVLKKGGAFEMLEEDLFFPGSITTADDEGVEEGSDEDQEDEGMGGKPAATHPLTPSIDEMHEPRSSDDTLRGDVDLMQNGTRRHTSVQQNEMTSNGLGRAMMGRDVLNNVHFEDLSVISQDFRQRMSLDTWLTRSNEQTVADILSGPIDVDFRGDDSLFHPHVNPIMNPRDHSVLEAAYNELHAARFINLSPLSGLNLMLGLHFKDVRSHEPIQVLFPRLPPTKNKSSSASKRPASLFTASLVAFPSYPATAWSSTTRRQSCSKATSQQQHEASLPSLGIELRPLGMVMTRDSSCLSSKEWGFDESLLHMHLSARVSEVLSCSEEMWEFIREVRSSPERWRNSALAALADVTREQWEDCLSRYQMDMHDRISLGQVLSSQSGWPMPPMTRTPERKSYDEAVEKWEKQRKRHKEQAGPHKRKHALPVSRVFQVFTARKE